MQYSAVNPFNGTTKTRNSPRTYTHAVFVSWRRGKFVAECTGADVSVQTECGGFANGLDRARKQAAKQRSIFAQYHTDVRVRIVIATKGSS